MESPTPQQSVSDEEVGALTATKQSLLERNESVSKRIDEIRTRASDLQLERLRLQSDMQTLEEESDEEMVKIKALQEKNEALRKRREERRQKMNADKKAQESSLADLTARNQRCFIEKDEFLQGIESSKRLKESAQKEVETRKKRLEGLREEYERKKERLVEKVRQMEQEETDLRQKWVRLESQKENVEKELESAMLQKRSAQMEIDKKTLQEETELEALKGAALQKAKKVMESKHMESFMTLVASFLAMFRLVETLKSRKTIQTQTIEFLNAELEELRNAKIKVKGGEKWETQLKHMEAELIHEIQTYLVPVVDELEKEEGHDEESLNDFVALEMDLDDLFDARKNACATRSMEDMLVLSSQLLLLDRDSDLFLLAQSIGDEGMPANGGASPTIKAEDGKTGGRVATAATSKSAPTPEETQDDTTTATTEIETECETESEKEEEKEQEQDLSSGATSGDIDETATTPIKSGSPSEGGEESPRTPSSPRSQQHGHHHHGSGGSPYQSPRGRPPSPIKHSHEGSTLPSPEELKTEEEEEKKRGEPKKVHFSPFPAFFEYDKAEYSDDESWGSAGEDEEDEDYDLDDELERMEEMEDVSKSGETGEIDETNVTFSSSRRVPPNVPPIQLDSVLGKEATSKTEDESQSVDEKPLQGESDLEKDGKEAEETSQYEVPLVDDEVDEVVHTPQSQLPSPSQSQSQSQSQEEEEEEEEEQKKEDVKEKRSEVPTTTASKPEEKETKTERTEAEVKVEKGNEASSQQSAPPTRSQPDGAPVSVVETPVGDSKDTTKEEQPNEAASGEKKEKPTEKGESGVSPPAPSPVTPAPVTPAPVAPSPASSSSDAAREERQRKLDERRKKVEDWKRKRKGLPPVDEDSKEEPGTSDLHEEKKEEEKSVPATSDSTEEKEETSSSVEVGEEPTDAQKEEGEEEEEEEENEENEESAEEEEDDMFGDLEEEQALREAEEARKKAEEEENRKKREALIALLTEGASFMKHGRSGAPHKRVFVVTPALDEIHWKESAKGKVKEKDILKKSEIENIVKGKTTKAFSRRKKTPEANCLSMTAQKRDLDMEFSSEQERDYWFDQFVQWRAME
eukprot:TRINITY_DN146_c1_g2_i10.p1 TRINITY_DN146_c1_g2~~TRINITY_DN146_c1_g2_i10.p1  ORF type:complete len:1117 (+),score=516.02 TRINITY_DN146_c1_g2_i10:80-3352(+)